MIVKVWNYLVKVWDKYSNFNEIVRPFFSKTCFVCLGEFSGKHCPRWREELHREYDLLCHIQARGEAALAKRERVLSRLESKKPEIIKSLRRRQQLRRNNFESMVIAWKMNIFRRSWRKSYASISCYQDKDCCNGRSV